METHLSASSTDDKVITGAAGADTVPAGAAKDVATADPSPAEGKDEPSLLDAVTAALEPEGGKSPGPETDGKDTPEAGAKDAKSEDDQPLGDVTEAELASYKPRTRRRVEQLLHTVKAHSGELESLRPQAAQFQQIARYMQQHELIPQEVNTGLTIMALMKSDPVKAYEMLKPYTDQLESIVGVKLPADLRKQVDEGLLTEDHARSLVRSRATADAAEARARRTTESTEQERQVAQHQAAVGAMANAVSGIEAQWLKSDPDYPKKQADVVKSIKLAILEGMQSGSIPRNPQEAVALANRCKAEVDVSYKRFAPAKVEVKNVRANGSAADARPEPKSHEEALRQAVGM